MVTHLDLFSTYCVSQGYIIVMRPADKKKFKKVGEVGSDALSFTLNEKIKAGEFL